MVAAPTSPAADAAAAAEGEAWEGARDRSAEALLELYECHCKVLQVKPNSSLLRDLAGAAKSNRPLTRLDVRRNYLGERGFQAMVEVIRQATALRDLRLGGNGLTNDAVMSLCRAVQDHPTLTSIDLSSNEISLPSVSSIVDLLRRNALITAVSVEDTHIEDRARLKIGKALQANVRLGQKKDRQQKAAPQTALNADHETPFQKAKREFNERREDRRAAAARASDAPEAEETASMHLRRRLPNVPPRDEFGWVVLNVYVSATQQDFCSELDHLHRVTIPRLNEKLKARKVYLHPVTAYYDATTKHLPAEVPYSPMLLVAERLELIKMCSPMFLMLVGDKHGPVPGFVPPRFAGSAQLKDVAQLDQHPMALVEGFYGGVHDPSSCALYFVRSSSRTLSAPQGIMESFTDDYSYLHAGEESDEHPATARKTQASRGSWESWKGFKKTVLDGPEALVLKKYPGSYETVTRHGKILLSGLQKYEHAVESRLLEVVEYLYPEGDRGAVSRATLAPERMAAELRKEYLRSARPCLGRHNALSKLELYIVSPTSRNIMLFHGPKGAGKDAVMAGLASKCLARENYKTGFFMVGHAGLVRGSCSLRSCLISICEQLGGDALHALRGEVSLRTVKEHFRKLLQQVSDREKNTIFVVVIDGLDRLLAGEEPPEELGANDLGHNILSGEGGKRAKDARHGELDWIPMCLPKNVRIIVSVDDTEETLLKALLDRGQDSCEALAVLPPGVPDAEQLIRAELEKHRIELTKEQMDMLLEKSEIRSTVYQQLLTHTIIQKWDLGPVSGPVAFLQGLPGTVAELVEHLLRYGEGVCGEALMAKGLSALALQDEGLLLLQMRELLADPENGVERLCGRDLGAFMHAARPFLREQVALTQGVRRKITRGSLTGFQPEIETPLSDVANGLSQRLQIAHSDVKDAILRRYLPAQQDVRSFYATLCHYLRPQGELVSHPLAVHGLSAFPQAMIAARMWPSIARYFFSIATVRRFFEFGIGFVLFDNMIRAYTVLHRESEGGRQEVTTREASGVEQRTYPAHVVKAWLFRMKEYVHFVHGSLPSLKAYPSLTVQQALAALNDTNIYKEAQEYYDEHQEERYYTRVNKQNPRTWPGEIRRVEFSRNALRVLLASERSFTFCNVQGDVIHHIAMSATILHAFISSTSRYAVIVTFDKTILVYDAVTAAAVSKLAGHTGRIRCCAMSARAGVVISGSEDGTVKVWGSESGKNIATLSHQQFCTGGRFPSVLAVAPHAEDEAIFLSAVDRTVLLWRKDGATSYELVFKVTCHTEYTVNHVQWLPYQDKFLTCVRRPPTPAYAEASVTPMMDTAIKVWDMTNGTLKYRLHGTDDSHVNSVDISSDEKYVAAALDDGRVVVWDMQDAAGTGECDIHPVQVIDAFTRSASKVTFLLHTDQTGAYNVCCAVGDGIILKSYRMGGAFSLLLEYVFHSKITQICCAPVATAEGGEVAAGDVDGRLYILKGHRLPPGQPPTCISTTSP
eukprot:TRINITY_DN198_c0_g1_i1.p1 TRINITY_DN198_c0_g1~~TRINITY_DN198_c0_g1_i1.p1  ORF type:complete len:1495 (+),score=544.93 TRINITY_DN198_c0_g1_i1:64-4548(+)